jgi:hypothetical protein
MRAIPIRTVVHDMPNFRSLFEPSPIPSERRRCLNCQSGRMMLVRALPGFGGTNLRTFECARCDHVLKVLVEYPIDGKYKMAEVGR